MNTSRLKIQTCIIAVVIAATCSITSCSQSSSQNKSAIISNNFYDISEKKDDIILNFAIMGEDTILKQAAEKFNEIDNGYCIKFTEYNQQGYGEVNSGELELSDFELIQDIINTDNIDIIASCAFKNEDNYRMLQKKGAFVDLYPFMNNDSEINIKTLNNNVISAIAIDEKLYSLPTFYCIYTMGGDPKYVGNKNNWTYDDMMQYWDAMPDNATIHGKRTKEEAFYTLISPNLASYIDYEDGKVKFNSQEFKKCLEFCNSFDYGNQEKKEYDFNAPQFINTLNIDSFMGIWPFEISSEFPKLTFVGFPSMDGRGAFFKSCGKCFSISSKSSLEKQKAAWEFIRTFVTEEWQIENVLSPGEGKNKTEIGFCINNNAFETIKNNVVNKEYSEETYQNKNEEFDTVFPSKEDCDKLTEYINSIDRWEVTLNDSIYQLINEEIMMYFSGEISIDKCVNNIQERASLWISEQY
ncbi:extracellular solute-binding protein [Ruminococcus sp.]|uniref:extracellular solute-binding protein n=1 Tax=Ruminococcus sp. TaxID=41978 RepID=UPI0025F62AC2|nr:extracellular solute-binding protein [Ruminococcus sp.]